MRAKNGWSEQREDVTRQRGSAWCLARNLRGWHVGNAEHVYGTGQRAYTCTAGHRHTYMYTRTLAHTHKDMHACACPHSVHTCRHCLPAMMLFLLPHYFVTPPVPVSQSARKSKRVATISRCLFRKFDLQLAGVGQGSHGLFQALPML